MPSGIEGYDSDLTSSESFSRDHVWMYCQHAYMQELEWKPS